MSEEIESLGFIFRPKNIQNESLPESIKYITPTQEQWEEHTKKCMKQGGWTLDRDDEKTLGFTCKDKNTGDTWIRDYDKKSRNFVHFNGDHMLNLIVTKKVKNE